MTPASITMDAAVASPWDVIIVGAGPAGSLAAREIARLGARVLLVDKKGFPRSKVCGACLNGRALDLLGAVGLGALPARQGAVPLDAFELRVRGRGARLALPGGVALSRARLDAALVEAAIAAGAAFLPSVMASVEPAREDVRSVRLTGSGQGAETTARVVLVAAGLGNACLVREPAIKTVVAARSRIGAGCAVPDAPAVFGVGTIFMAVARAGYVGLVRVEDGSLNVAAALDPAAVKARGAAAVAAAVLKDAGFPAVPGLETADWRGTAGLTRRTRPLAASRLFVLGDAAGYIEPFTGEGMAWALEAGAAVAPLAVRGCERWEPIVERRWADVFRQRIERKQHLCHGLALILRYPALASLAVALVDRAPGLAGPFLRRQSAGAAPLEATAR